MLCPECIDEMLILELDGVEIDYCDECRGIWLDEGELELLLETDKDTDLPILKALTSPDTVKAKGAKKCPVCNKKMLLVDIPLNPVVEIDRCPDNHGLWFDQGELEQIISASKGTTVADFLGAMFGGVEQV
jgi:uncharacterized protein